MIDRAFARRLFHTVPFSIGLVGVIAASAPLAIGSILDALGLIRIGNGLGVGMWFFFVFWALGAADRLGRRSRRETSLSDH